LPFGEAEARFWEQRGFEKLCGAAGQQGRSNVHRARRGRTLLLLLLWCRHMLACNLLS